MIEQLAEYLSQAGLVPAVNLFLGTMPDAPQNCVTIYEYSGGKPSLELGTNRIVEEQRSFQFVFRHENYQEAFKKAREVFHVFTSDNHFSFYPLQSPFSLGRSNGLWRIAFNARIMI